MIVHEAVVVTFCLIFLPSVKGEGQAEIQMLGPLEVAGFAFSEGSARCYLSGRLLGKRFVQLQG